MESRKKNKQSIVTAFIVGTTMFSSVDKAWGMEDVSSITESLRKPSKAVKKVFSASRHREDAEKNACGHDPR